MSLLETVDKDTAKQFKDIFGRAQKELDKGEVTSVCLIVNKTDGHSHSHLAGNYPELIGSIEVRKSVMVEALSDRSKLMEMQETVSNMPDSWRKMFEKMINDDDD
ncbi:MAG: hypothetical protein LKF01_00280 [Lactobacillus sp.]|jgi:hypothetical protein|nr:hypothetical protein [Lactobacillus sp.]MCH4067980.1 hypothetical protein [Lactobacillus sp.]MCI1304064.1 hypothetical protein [Lactobacillus sp.]MCI1329910.1 hypothetical protein [Lactobacillus sp.]MCI1399510.1 hypothetical protein [Lactobacillus sp.]